MPFCHTTPWRSLSPFGRFKQSGIGRNTAPNGPAVPRTAVCDGLTGLTGMVGPHSCAGAARRQGTRAGPSGATTARSVIIATGARYNRLPVDRLAEFEGVGVYYAATQAEAQACGTGPVAVVGGGNSAGQAALFLSRSCSKVHVIIRRDALDDSMSRYLVDRIERNPGIVVWPSTQVTALTGTNRLEAVRLRRGSYCGYHLPRRG